MDKETLSNYGWIVIAVLVLVVMIALATPFGKFVSQAVQSTTEGLFGVNQNALGAVNITVADQKINVPCEDETPTPKEETPAPLVGSVTFYCYYDEDGESIEGPFVLTWEELKDPANGNKFMYDASKINDTTMKACWTTDMVAAITVPDGITTIEDQAFFGNIPHIVLPNTITTIGRNIFTGLYQEAITYNGTIAQWNAIDKHEDWYVEYGSDCYITIHCTDGDIDVDISRPFPD